MVTLILKGCGMETVERIIKKMIFIQLVFLLFFQGFFHRDDTFHKWKALVQYEGVLKENYSSIVEALSGGGREEEKAK